MTNRLLIAAATIALIATPGNAATVGDSVKVDVFTVTFFCSNT